MKIYLSITFLFVGFLTSCLKNHTSSSTSHALESDDFHTFIASPGMLNIVDFSSDLCPPCKKLKPVLVALAERYSDTVRLGIIDVDQAKSLAAQHRVRGVPDVRFFVNGRQVDQFTGAAPEDYIEQIIAHHLAKHDNELNQPKHPVTAIEEPIQTLPINPAVPPSPTMTPNPAETPNPSVPSTPTIQPAKENPLPPGMSKG